jgi:2-amino-4-hydroxy-6-hydroxymethyldihydropteridine diphosphokinase
MPRCYLALGGNLGRVAVTFERALESLRRDPAIGLVGVSRFVETVPLGGDQPVYLNAVAALDTTASAIALLDLARKIEADCGRVRDVRWGPRTLDLDLILYGHDVIDTARLNVPHPACWYRRFVLDPLVEIAPDAWHPVKQLTASQLRDRLLARPFHLSIAGESVSARVPDLIESLQPEFPDVVFTDWRERDIPSDRNPAPTIVAWLGPRGDTDVSFDDLPLAERLDASDAAEPPDLFLGYVLQAALGR